MQSLGNTPMDASPFADYVENFDFPIAHDFVK
jgi:hypothetical protein